MDELVGDEEWLVCIGGAQTIEGEATGQTSDGSEQRLEGFRHVMRDEVFVDLNHSPPQYLLVREFGFATNADDRRVVVRGGGNEPVERVPGDGLRESQPSERSAQEEERTVSASIVKMYS